MTKLAITPKYCYSFVPWLKIKTMDTNITFEKLPEAMGKLLSDVAEIKDKMARIEQVRVVPQTPSTKVNPREV